MAKSELQVGDVVGYSKQFLQSIGVYTGEMPQLRGVITRFVQLANTTLADITWNESGSTSKVNVKNLVTVKRIQLGED